MLLLVAIICDILEHLNFKLIVYIEKIFECPRCKKKYHELKLFVYL